MKMGVVYTTQLPKFIQITKKMPGISKAMGNVLEISEHRRRIERGEFDLKIRFSCIDVVSFNQ